jgi:hypothetical protein
MQNTEEVLAFIRSADRDTWHLIAEEIRRDTLRRDLEAARSFRVGEAVSFNHPFGNDRITGHIAKINRRGGRVTVLTDLGEGPTTIGLLATMVMSAK